VADRTDWRKMLKGTAKPLDLPARRDELLARCATELQALETGEAEGRITRLADAEPVAFHYPVEQYPAKVASLNLDKTPTVSGTLLGVKGQYLILDSGVLNVRKFAGYRITLTA